MNNNNQIIIYQVDDDQTQIDVRLENETVWLTTQQMAMLFDREESNIRRHVINVFKEGELKKENNVHFLHVNGVKKPDTHYMWTKAFQANIIWNLNSKSLWKSQNQTGGSVGRGVLQGLFLG